MAVSRLRAAWVALGLGVAGLMGAAVLAPAPRPAGEAFEIALPDAPDPYAPAAGRAAEGVDAADEAASDPADDGPALPRIVFGDDGAADTGPDAGGEVVITIGGGGENAPSPARRRAAVPPGAPDARLTADTASGPRPAIGADGRTPFAAYRRLEPVGEARGVAVIVSGLGLDADLTRRAIALPPSVSLSFAPYAKDLPAQIERARAAGHEVLIELPMGTPGVAPAALGPAGLLAERSPAANDKRAEWLLTRAPAYPMVTNYLGAGFARDEAAMGRLMTMLSRAGVAYIDDTGLADDAARFAGVPYANAAMLIEPDTDDVAARLRALAGRAAAGEVSLAKLYAAPEALDALAAWAAALPETHALVPASTAVTAS